MHKWWNTQRFDLLELFLVVVFSSYCVWRATISILGIPREAAWFLNVYGSSHYSRGTEELIIRDFFRDKRAGFFVDVGAGHFRTNSNTFYLEERLGWSGIAVDPLGQFEADYRKHRPRTRYFALFVSDVSDQRARLFVSDSNSEVSSASREFTKAGDRSAEERMVPTITLTDLLLQQRVSHIDLLSIDVELSEPKVLAGFDVDRFKPALVCIEAHPLVRQQVLDYFTRHGAVVVGRYLRADTENLYFKPLN